MHKCVKVVSAQIGERGVTSTQVGESNVKSTHG